MIPKVIHYIWLGNREKNSLTNLCILSWHEKMPEYKIIEWNETNLDIEKICQENPFFNECRKRKLWAYMADYIRLKILYEQGGIYLDTDVFVLKNLDLFLENSLFIGKEDEININAAILGAEKKNDCIKSWLNFYETLIWEKPIYTIPQVISWCVQQYKQEDDITLFPKEYFYPYAWNETYERSCITQNTYTIHWWSGSWTENRNQIFLQIKHIKNPITRFLVRVKKEAGYFKRKILRM